jgi:hypothetical protein
MTTAAEARHKLYINDTLEGPGGPVRLLFLLPENQWRPLRVAWWRGKDVAIIAGDEHGNYVLRHCDGTVRLWEHHSQRDTVLAKSVHDFLAGLHEAKRS